MTVYVFGYGSLAFAPGEPVREHRLTDFARGWGVAMDNRIEPPGCKHYLDPGTGERADCYVAFLDIAAVPGAVVNGVLLETTPERLAALDRRERNYSRVAVTDQVEPSPPGEVHTFVGTEGGHRRRAAGLAHGTCVVDQHYLDVVRSGFAALGDGALRRFESSTAPPGCRIRPLVRRDP